MNKPWPAPTETLLPCQRALFDIPREVCFLNAASWSPLPLASQEAGRVAVGRKGQPWKLDPEFAPADFSFQAPLVNRSDDVIDLRFGRVRTCNDDHGKRIRYGNR